jgi:hypothetical protein
LYPKGKIQSQSKSSLPSGDQEIKESTTPKPSNIPKIDKKSKEIVESKRNKENVSDILY